MPIVNRYATIIPQTGERPCPRRPGNICRKHMENVMNTEITEMGFSKVNIDEPEVAPAAP